MKAMLINDKKEFVWSDVADPVCDENDVVIEVAATALNRADLMQREGNYPPPPGWPEWPGLEVAGTIIDAPATSRWKPGDRVCALLGGGGYAEKVKVPQNMVLSVPEGLSMEEAATIPEVFATAYLNLCIEGGMKSGDTVFIQAGASGLGFAAIQLAKFYGAKVITTVGILEKVEQVRRFGADVIVNHKTDDLTAVLEANPPDIALDCVAGASLGKNIEKMKPGGRWIVIASLSGDKTELDVGKFFRLGVKLIGSTLRSRSITMKGHILSDMEKLLWNAFSSKEIKPVIHCILPICDVERAHAILQNRENIGKVVLSLKQ